MDCNQSKDTWFQLQYKKERDSKSSRQLYLPSVIFRENFTNKPSLSVNCFLFLDLFIALLLLRGSLQNAVWPFSHPTLSLSLLLPRNLHLAQHSPEKYINREVWISELYNCLPIIIAINSTIDTDKSSTTNGQTHAIYFSVHLHFTGKSGTV